MQLNVVTRDRTEGERKLLSWLKAHTPPYSPAESAEQLALIAATVEETDGEGAARAWVLHDLAAMARRELQTYADAQRRDLTERRLLLSIYLHDGTARSLERLAAIDAEPRLAAYAPHVDRTRTILSRLQELAEQELSRYEEPELIQAMRAEEERLTRPDDGQRPAGTCRADATPARRDEVARQAQEIRRRRRDELARLSADLPEPALRDAVRAWVAELDAVG